MRSDSKLRSAEFEFWLSCCIIEVVDNKSGFNKRGLEKAIAPAAIAAAKKVGLSLPEVAKEVTGGPKRLLGGSGSVGRLTLTKPNVFNYA